MQAGIAITLAYGVAMGAWYSKGLLAWHTEEGKADYHDATCYYDEYAWINENLPESAKLLVFANSGRTYYLDREYVRADPRLSAAIQWTSVKNVESFRRVLNELEIDHIFVNWAVLTSALEAPHLTGLFEELASSEIMEMLWTREDVKFFRSRIREEYTTRDVSLFKLVDPITPSAQPPHEDLHPPL
jgi:hypothetical protein